MGREVPKGCGRKQHRLGLWKMHTNLSGGRPRGPSKGWNCAETSSGKESPATLMPGPDRPAGPVLTGDCASTVHRQAQKLPPRRYQGHLSTVGWDRCSWRWPKHNSLPGWLAQAHSLPVSLLSRSKPGLGCRLVARPGSTQQAGVGVRECQKEPRAGQDCLGFPLPTRPHLLWDRTDGCRTLSLGEEPLVQDVVTPVPKASWGPVPRNPLTTSLHLLLAPPTCTHSPRPCVALAHSHPGCWSWDGWSGSTAVGCPFLAGRNPGPQGK